GDIVFLMYYLRAFSRLQRCRRLQYDLRCTFATTPYSTPEPHASRITDADVTAARSYCSNLLQKFDSPSYTLQTFIPHSGRDAYLSIRALNIELARIPDLVSNPSVGSLRMQFWRDNITRTFADTPPKEPVAMLLHNALTSLRSRHPGISTSVMKGWFMKVIGAREQYMDNRPYTSMDALETYAENTYSTLMYLTLATLPLHSLEVDHVASHIGKATGIIAVLRGLPLIAFPPPPNDHSNNSASGGAWGIDAGTRQGAVILPLDVMAETGVKEEEVLRQGAVAPGLKDAIFTVATRANDHLITAREMLKNLQQGKEAGHEFEHEGEEGHQYTGTKSNSISDLERGFGVLMQAIPTRLWLETLEKHDFDVFRPELRAREWKLPWKAYWGYNRRSL
ncbi:NADH dehydrogenase (ubiquinone) complex assembly factor 6, partial [Hyphodiscus hymeniophilus]